MSPAIDRNEACGTFTNPRYHWGEGNVPSGRCEKIDFKIRSERGVKKLIQDAV
jgi:hypothetical protein